MTLWTSALVAAPAALLALGALPLAFQRHLLFPRSKNNAVLQSPHHRIEPVEIRVPGARLKAYLAVPLQPAGPPRGLLYFNGRREHPTSVFRCLHEMPGLHALCFHYRGLGPAWRKPGEAQLVADGLAVLDWMAQACGLRHGDIAIGGRSLGSGLAVQVSGARPVRCLALVSPFDRAHSAVRQALPFVRGWMLKDRFESVDHMALVRCPVLLVLGERDRTVPPAASRRLLQGWRGAWQEFALPDMGHRGLLRHAPVQQRLAAFWR